MKENVRIDRTGDDYRSAFMPQVIWVAWLDTQIMSVSSGKVGERGGWEAERGRGYIAVKSKISICSRDCTLPIVREQRNKWRPPTTSTTTTPFYFSFSSFLLFLPKNCPLPVGQFLFLWASASFRVISSSSSIVELLIVLPSTFTQSYGWL